MDRHNLWPNEELTAEYRRLFSGKGSEDVMLHMLFDLGVFEESTNEEDTALRNYGIRLMKILGGGHIDRDAIREFIKRLVRQPLKNERAKET